MSAQKECHDSDAHDGLVVPEAGELHEPRGAPHLGHARLHRVKPVEAHLFVTGGVDEEKGRVPSAGVRDGRVGREGVCLGAEQLAHDGNLIGLEVSE